MRTGATTTITISAVLGAGALGVAVRAVSMGTTGVGSTAAAAARVHATTLLASPSTGEIDQWIRRAGLTPEIFSACGFSASQTSTRIGDARAEVIDRHTQLTTAQQSLDTAVGNVERLRRLVASGTATEGDKTSLAAAETALTTAQNALQAELDRIFDAATSGLSTMMKNNMTRSHANTSHWGLPHQYCVIDRTDNEWADLREAVAGKRIKDRTGRTQDQALIDALATADAHSDVSTAKSNLDSTLSEVTIAFNNAVAGL